MESTHFELLVPYRGHVEMECMLLSVVVTLLFKQWLQCSEGNLILSFLWSVRAEGREPAKALMSRRTEAMSSEEKTFSARELLCVGPLLWVTYWYILDVLPLYFSLFDASFFSKITAIARLPDAFRGSPSINWFSLLRRTKSSSCIQKIGIGVHSS